MKTRPWSPPRPRSEPRTVLITARQAQILDGLFRGLTAAQIARSLFVEEETVRSHRSRLYRRLGANSAAQAVGLATSGQVCVQVRVDAWKAPKVRAS